MDATTTNKINYYESPPKPSTPVASHSCTDGSSIEQEGGYYYELFKFFSDNHSLTLVDTEIRDIIQAIKSFKIIKTTFPQNGEKD